MVNAKVNKIIKANNSDIGLVLLEFELDRKRKNAVEDLLCVDEKNRYFITVKDIGVLYEMMNGEFTPMDYFQYVIIPIRKALKNDEHQSEIIKNILEKFDPDYKQEEDKSIKVIDPSYKLPGFLIPYARELFNKGEIKIKYGEHIGKSRGLDAANFIKTEIKKFIVSGLETTYSTFSPDLRHDGGDSVVRCYFGNEDTFNYFREIFLRL